MDERHGSIVTSSKELALKFLDKVGKGLSQTKRSSSPSISDAQGEKALKKVQGMKLID